MSSDCKLKEEILEISKEISLIKDVQTEKLPHLYGIIIDDTERFELVFEFIDRELLNNLYHTIDNKTKLDVVRQLVEILVILHSNKFIHRRIEPQNIKIENENVVRLFDYGFSKITENILGTTLIWLQIILM